MGVVLAATPAMPALSEFTGQIAIEQGRADDDARELGSLQMSQTDLAPDLIPKTADDNTDLDEPDSPQLEHSGEDSPSDNASLNVRLDYKSPVPAAAAAQTMPALPLHLRSIQRSRASQDPLGQLDAQIPSHQSSLSLPGPRASRPTTPNTPDILLEKYDFPAQAQLLRGHYCHSQVCRLFKPTLHMKFDALHRSSSFWIWRISVSAFSLSPNPHGLVHSGQNSRR